MQYKKEIDNTTMVSIPMLVEERFDRLFFRDIVEAIFATDNKDEAYAVIDEFSKFGCPNWHKRCYWKENCKCTN